MIKYLHPDAPLIDKDLLSVCVCVCVCVCLTTHFIDKDWVLTKMVLNFSFMPPPHNGISLCEKTYNMLEEWEIKTKVSITLDNASSNDICVGLLRNKLNIKKALICEGEFFSHLLLCTHS
jgi:hypothetical protein